MGLRVLGGLTRHDILDAQYREPVAAVLGVGADEAPVVEERVVLQAEHPRHGRELGLADLERTGVGLVAGRTAGRSALSAVARAGAVVLIE